MSNEKLFPLGNYKPRSQNELSFIKEIKLALNIFSSSYQNFLLPDSFNLTREKPNSKNSPKSFESLIKIPTSNKSYHPPICTDFGISK